MSSIIENYFALMVRDSGEAEGFGSLRAAIGEATLGGDHILAKEKLSIDPEDYIVLFEQSHRKLRFEELGFIIVGEGTLQVAVRTDRATDLDNDDYTALGTSRRWRFEDWPCKLGPKIWSAQTVLSHATLTSEVLDTGGLPDLLNAGLSGAETRIIDKIILRNPDPDETVIVQKFHVQ